MKILLVDDHALFRDGLALVLGRLADAPTLLHAETALQGIELAGKELNLDLVLLDLGLPDANGLDTLAALRLIAPAAPVVIVSASHGRDEIERALSLGAQGFIPKSTTAEIMLSALRLVLAGGVYLPPDLLEPMAPGSTVTGTNAGEVMTERQREVLRLLVGGKSNKQIGTALDISESTVRVHVTALFRILGVSNRTEASYAARRLRWLD